MTALNKQALREAAIHAQSSDDWGYDGDNFHDKATPDAVLMLLDELDAAEKRIAELRDWNFGLAQESFTYQQRVAELESRTVTVKLPADYRNSDGSINADMFNTCAVVDAFRDALAAAGIGVKGE
ncbi:ead/Ea22-like family protein [Citrobacter freundii]|uniref:ead/Ea22-like family protein n=1 Tax=Citrobacter freundii TaxID=546 RepID=UPI00254A71D5|nr:ead/Ea22-like family protein [Citrobacter freundii]MDK6379997.1 ead/Ea22-like family protein [Citrobacter freundii]